MASLTGDGAERPEGAVPAASPPTPPTAGGDRAGGPGPAATPAVSPVAAAPAASAQSVEPSATPALPPPMAVPTVRVRPERPAKGITTASDYVAPRELPAHTPQPVEAAAAKVVIHVPDAGQTDAATTAAAPSEAEVAELRQRRRAPTLKIDRSAVKELKALDDARAAAAVAQIIEAPVPSARATAAPLVADAPRPLARPAPERPSPRRTGWIVALVATAVVGGGALAVGLGYVPLAPVEDPPAAASPPTAESVDSRGAPAATATSVTEPPAASAAPSAAEVATATPPASASVTPAASGSGASSAPAAPAASTAPSTAPRPAPWRPAPRRPKGDIPSGI